MLCRSSGKAEIASHSYHVRLITYNKSTPPLPLPACGPGRQSTALAGWGEMFWEL